MSLTYEAVILFGVVFFFDYAFSSLTQFKGQPGVLRWVSQAWLFAVLGVYFTYFWSDGRRSLPMKTMSVELLGPGDAPVSKLRAFVRYTAAVACLAAALALAHFVSLWLSLLFLVPFAVAVVDPHRRALYDLISGTRLAVSPPMIKSPASKDPQPAN